MNIGEVIKCKRQERAMTQAELAALLNITPQAVSRWEMRVSYPDIAMLPKLSQVLGVTADELLGIRPYDASESSSRNVSVYLNQSQADSIFDYVPSAGSQNPKTILVADDSEFLRSTLEDILTRRGHTVLPAANGQECLCILQKENVDVCLLDIVMPVMDGTEVLRRIKKEKPKIKVIMLSALSQESNVKLALQLGADAFVVKPFQAASLIERIDGAFSDSE